MSTVERHALNTPITSDTGGFLETRAEIRRHLPENGNLTSNNLLAPAGRHVSGNGLNETFLGLIAEHFLPKGARGVKVLRTDLTEVTNSFTDELTMHFVEVDSPLLELNGLDTRKIGRSSALIVECHGTIALEVARCVRGGRLVDWKLLVVGTNTVAVGVRVREESRLEYRVGRGFHTWDHMSRVECCLFNLSKVVLQGVNSDIIRQYCIEADLHLGYCSR